MSTIPLTYGSERLTVEIIEPALAGSLLEPRRAEGGAAPREAIQAALEEPVGRPRLRESVEGKLVGLVIPDDYHPGMQELLIREMAAELRAGRPRAVWVFCATGFHDPQIHARQVGTWVRRHFSEGRIPYKFFPHHLERSPHTHLGTTSLGTEVMVETAFLKTEVRVYAQESRYHYLAGYASVDQQISPGLCARPTIEQNHTRSMSLLAQPGRSPWHPDPERRSNPLSEDAREIREIVERCWINSSGEVVEQDQPLPTFLLNLITDNDQVYWIRAGDPAEILPEMEAALDQQAMFELPRSRYVVISPGGPAITANIYSVQSCFDTALLGAIMPGGEALIVAPCEGRPEQPEEVRGLAPDTVSKELFWDNLVRFRDEPLDACYDWIHSHFQLYLWKTYRILRLFKETGVRIWIHSRLPAETLAAGGFLACENVQEWVDERVGRGDGRLRLIERGSRLLVRGVYEE